MTTKQILFTGVCQAELAEAPLRELTENDVLTEMEYTVVSGGPKQESYPHHWTHQDDCTAILDLIAAGRIQVAPMVSRVVSPENAPEIYEQLCNDPQFPMGTVFDWKGIV